MQRVVYPGINMGKTGNWLRFICRFKRITVKGLCKQLGISCPQSIYGWFRGKTLPSLDNFYELSQVLDVTLGDLIVNQQEVIPENFCKKMGLQNTRLMRYRMKLEF